ncbi:MAG: lectin like domain-containing protein [Oscillospiraceae bacterium]|jgi:C1A family cysteine protease|nr:lectin like domain-containing protein [Oscillospiraceae bacterium]
MKHFRSGAAILTALAVLLAAGLPAKAADTDVSCVQQGTLQEHNGFLSMAQDHAETAQPNGRLRTAGLLPASYDLRTENRITPVKDQLSNGTCWAFGALGSAESCLLTGMRAAGKAFSSVQDAGNAVNLSEKHLVWFAFHGRNTQEVSRYAGGDTFYTTYPFSVGGSRIMSVPTLARWYGAADEKDLPYSVNSDEVLTNVTDSALQTVSRVHLQDADFLPEPVLYHLVNGYPDNITYSSSARNSIKQCILGRGAVSGSYHSPTDESEQNRFYKGDTCGYYCNDKNVYFANHEVTIVGWDDNYSRNNFITEPQGNGAWLVRNSWGDSDTWKSDEHHENTVGKDGYFYLSYYDVSFSEPTFFQMENTSYAGASTKHTYQDIYQYDGTGVGVSAWSMNVPARFANLFTARQDMKLQAVSVQAPDAGATVTASVYVNPKEAGNPTSGARMASFSKTYRDAGYYTEDLGSQSTLLKKGDTFAVVEQVSYPADGKTQYGVLLESSYDGMGTSGFGVNVDCSAGQSYYSIDGAAWKEQGSSRLNVERGITTGNATIKAFSNPASVQSTLTGGIDLPLGTERVFTVKSASRPNMVCGSGSTAQLRVLKNWDSTSKNMVLAVYGCGSAGRETGIYDTGSKQRLFTVALQKRPFSSDTTVNMTRGVGQNYTFSIVPDNSVAVPSFTVGNGRVLAAYYTGKAKQANGKTAYYFRFRCLKPGCTGIYIKLNGMTYQIFNCTVK